MRRIKSTLHVFSIVINDTAVTPGEQPLEPESGARDVVPVKVKRKVDFPKASSFLQPVVEELQGATASALCSPIWCYCDAVMP